MAEKLTFSDFCSNNFCMIYPEDDIALAVLFLVKLQYQYYINEIVQGKIEKYVTIDSYSFDSIRLQKFSIF